MLHEDRARARRPRGFRPQAGALEARALLSGTTGQPAVVSYLEAGTQKIYAFENGANGHLEVNYWDGKAWHWADQGTPPGTTAVGKPDVITYSEGGTQKIYAFDAGANGHLYVSYWDGKAWHWADQGLAPGTTVASDPSVITYAQGGTQRIYAFSSGANGHLEVDYWDGKQWRWADQGTPAGSTVTLAPSAVTYAQGGTQRIYAFARGSNGHLEVNYWDGSKWQWSDRGEPSNAYINSPPSAVTYSEGGTQRFDVFARGSDGTNFYRLYKESWDGKQWAWSDQGLPNDTYQFTGSAPGVIAYSEGGTERVYAFVRGLPGNLDVNYWDGKQWHWSDRGTLPGIGLVGAPSAITYSQGGAQRIYAFDNASNGRLVVHYWDGKQWHWADQGLPPGTTL
jgi:hypothetical protein